MADSGAVVASNPGSNLRLSSGICRTRDMLDAGVRVAVGTDGISATEREDYLAELRLSAYLQRVPRALESGRVNGPAYLRSAAESGAQAARMSDRIGSLEPGRDADLVVLSRARVFWPPNRYDLADPIDVILDRADLSDIELVMVQGRPVLDGGAITTVDEAAIRGRHEEACERAAVASLAGATSEPTWSCRPWRRPTRSTSTGRGRTFRSARATSTTRVRDRRADG